MTPIEEHLEKFTKKFDCKKVIANGDYRNFRYSTPHHAAASCCKANKVIEDYKLPLVAIYSQGCDFFTVQSNQTPDI